MKEGETKWVLPYIKEREKAERLLSEGAAPQVNLTRYIGKGAGKYI